jgi:ActR/RegA family two-component response regulator
VWEMERGRQAELRAKRIRWRGRSRSTSQASRNVGECLRRVNAQASTLDARLSRHAEESRR